MTYLYLSVYFIMFIVEILQKCKISSFYVSVFRRDCYSHGVPVKSVRIFGEWVNRTPVRRRVRIHAFPKGLLKLFYNLRDWVNSHFANP